MRTLPLLENRKSGGDKVEDFLGKGDYQPTGQGQEPLRTLGGIMALEGQTDLYDTPAQQNIPMARIREKMNVERLFTTPRGSLPAAKVVVERQQAHNTTAA